MGVRWRRQGAPGVWVFACAVALLVLRATPAAAQPRSPEADVSAAEQAYVDLDFDQAIRLGEAAAARGGLSHAQLVRTYALLGRAHAVLDHDAEAREAFVKLLTYSPDEKEDRNLPPRVTTRMTEARGVLSGYPVRPGIEVLPVLVAASGAGTGGTLRVIVRDPTHVVQRLVVGWRWGEGATFATANPTVGAEVEVPLPAAPPPATRLDYYASALDERDDVVFEVGTPAAPKTAFAPTPPPVPLVVAPPTREPAREGTTVGRSIFVAPTFWGITAGIVACVGTGAYFALRKPRDELTPPTGAELAPWLVCGPSRCQ